MGWFDEQIKQRKISDNDIVSDTFIEMAGVVLGRNMSSALSDQQKVTKEAFDEIMKFYHVPIRDIPASITDVNDQLEYMLRPYGIMRRNVILEKGWYKDAFGGMLAQYKGDGSIVALIPSGLSGYSYIDRQTGKWVKINKKNEQLFEKEAISFYKPFPLRRIGVIDLVKYIMELVSGADIALTLMMSGLVTMIGLFLPYINKVLFSDVVSAGKISVLVAISIFLLCVSISNTLITAASGLVQSRLGTKLEVSVEAATMMRILSLPADFFKDYSAGELNSYSMYIGQLCEILVQTVLSIGLTSIFSLVYIVQILSFAPTLVVPSLCITLVTVLFSLSSAFVQMKISKQRMQISSKEDGMVYAMISGIQKIKLTGAENRAFARWGKCYTEAAKLEYNPPLLIKLNPVISGAITLIGTIIMYAIAIGTHVSVADYYAFNASYGYVSGAFTALAQIALVIANIKPILEMVKPIMDAKPEISEGKQVVTSVSGGIELNQVSFRYNDSMPYVLDNISLKIKSGQYVAIVGHTGCGKSTLIRLLLGFESPQKGAVFYDGKDISRLDLKSLRQKIGVVMQNGKLFQDDIFHNIVISAPNLTLKDAWDAAELAGMADDIRNMPMGMNTLIAEGQGGISGGQKQRLMIARAIAPKPKILIFDEATSALDNITQKQVSDALESLKCTRIVVAHRLSTIKQCDRIIVLDKGHIVEDGTYEQLINNKGIFAELVERQRLDK